MIFYDRITEAQKQTNAQNQNNNDALLSLLHSGLTFQEILINHHDLQEEDLLTLASMSIMDQKKYHCN